MLRSKKTEEEIRRNRAARNKRFRERHRERLLAKRRQYYLDHMEEEKFKDKLRKSGISVKRWKDGTQQKDIIP